MLPWIVVIFIECVGIFLLITGLRSKGMHEKWSYDYSEEWELMVLGIVYTLVGLFGIFMLIYDSLKD
jgi:uncharacterized membrane protein HdeD (DUF308 family)